MKRKIKKYKTLIFFVIFLQLTFTDNAYAQPKAINGIIDLSLTDFENEGIINLSGEWEFYWNQLIIPGIPRKMNGDTIQYCEVPQLWDKRIIKGEKQNGIGYSTYRLKVITNNHIEALALRLKRIETSYKLWINDSLILSIGEVGENKEKSKPVKRTIEKTFLVPGKEFYITIQVSNFFHKKGGIENEIQLGLPDMIFKRAKKARGFEIFLIGALLITAFFHLGLFILRNKTYSLLYFSLLLFFELLHTSFNGEVFATYIFREFSWNVLIKLDFVSNYMVLAFAGLFFQSIFKKEISKKIIYIICIYSLLMTLIVLFTKAIFFTKLLIFYEIIAGLTLLYLIYGQALAIYRGKKGALFPLIGTIILLVSAVNDILFEMQIINTMYIFSFGMFLFILFQIYLLTQNFSKLYKKADKVNRTTVELERIRNSFLKKSTFDIFEPLRILASGYRANRAILFAYKNNELTIKAKFPKNENFENAKYPHELINHVIKKKKSVVIADAYSNEFYRGKEYLDKFKTKSALCVPFLGGDKITGLIYLENDIQFKAFTNEQRNIIKLLTNQISGMIVNFDFYNELESLNNNLAEIVEERTANVKHQREKIVTQRDEIKKQNEWLNSIYKKLLISSKSIRDSIKYAERIQKAILPKPEYIQRVYPDSFIFYRPKEALSGDFYWAETKIDNGKVKYIFTVADCTGHGVPGALMSIIGNNLLNYAVIECGLNKPSEILNNLQDNIKHKLHQGREKSDSKDGMDMSVISYEPKSLTLEYAGARNNLYLFRNDELVEIKADRMSIGGREHARISESRKFKNYEIQLKKNDVIYIFTDGFVDQIGGEEDRKFMKSRFKMLLSEIHTFSCREQELQLEKIFKLWKGNHTQIDDILVTGIKF